MKNKSILITGSAKRIGKAIALYMANMGWNVALHYDSSGDEAKSLVEAIKQKGVKSVAIKADLSDEGQVSNVMEVANNEMGEISCLVNNASVFENDNLQSFTKQGWDKHLNVNLLAPMFLSAEFVGQLEKTSKANIINMLDYCVLNLPDKFLSYSISKSALWTATQILAKQLAPNVRVNAIGPGHCLPNARETQESFEAAYKKTPLKIDTSPEEVCKAVEFIIESKSMTGQIIALDGGKHLVGAEFY